MHAIYQGEMHHEIALAESLMKRFANGSPQEFYTSISDEFREYGRMNGISVGSFKTLSQFRGLKAHGIKDFLTVSTYIFKKLGYFEDITLSHLEKKWGLMHSVYSVMNYHYLQPAHMAKLKDLVPKLIELHAADNTLRLNNHFLCHIVPLTAGEEIDMTLLHGVPRNGSNFAPEKNHGAVKSIQDNNNNKETALAAMQRTQLYNILKLIGYSDTENTFNLLNPRERQAGMKTANRRVLEFRRIHGT